MEVTGSDSQGSQNVVVKTGVGKAAGPQLCKTSLGVFDIDNPVRVFCLRTMNHKFFTYIVLGLIICNCVFLALTEPFATCCTPSQLEDPAWVVVDPSNFSFQCDLTNKLLDGATLQSLESDCCISHESVRDDPFNICADVGLRETQDQAELVFNVMFTIEMTIKIIALGFVSGKGAYIRDWWNVLDFVVVTVGWLSFVPGVANFSALRTFRVLRPLRTLSSIPGMRPIVSAVIACIKSMWLVLMLCLFLFTVFGIIGLQLFSGTLRGRCHFVDPTMGVGNYEHSEFSYPDWSFMSIVDSDEAPCALPCNTPNADGSFTFNPWTRSVDECLELAGGTCAARGSIILPNPWHEPGRPADAPDAVLQHSVSMPRQLLEALPADSTGIYAADAENGTFTQFYNRSLPYVEVVSFCLDTGVNQLGSGFANFDNIGYAWLTIFTSITLEGWVDVMYGIQASFGHSFLVFFYFFLMVWLCSFFMLELTLAVINDAYEEAAEQEAERLKECIESTLEEEVREHIPGTEEARQENAAALEMAKEREKHERDKRSQGLKPWGPRIIFDLVTGNAFTTLVTLLIVLNTVTLAMEHHNMSEGRIAFLNATNLIFTTAFTVEMVLKMVGLGPWQYVRDAFNVFDCVIVTISLVELALADEEGGGSGLGALRTFRLMRVFKLARSWKNLRKLLATILLSVLDVTNAAFLLVIIMFIFTLLGMQLFGGHWNASYFCEDPQDYANCIKETPRANFDSFWWGFVTVFQVLTGENWNEVMYIGKTVDGEISWIYFVALNIVGNYMVLNLFLAILLARFENDDDEDELDENGDEAPGNSASVAPMPADEGANQLAAKEQDVEPELIPVDPNKMIMNREAKACFVFPADMPLRIKVFEVINSSSFDNFILVLIAISTVLLAVEEPWIEDCRETTCKNVYDFLWVMDVILNVLFTSEMALKMFALGIVMHEHSYLRGGWNLLDFIIVNVSIASLMLNGGAIKALKSLRSLRALRPLRVISRSPGMRLVVNSIIAAIPAIANVTVVVILFMLIFAIIGVQNFMGGLNSCNDPNAPGPTMFDCVGYNATFPAGPNFTTLTWTPVGDLCGVLPTEALVEACLRNGTGGCETCLDGGGFPRVWGPNGGMHNSFNFDNVGQSLLVVFEVVSGEMWPDIMYATMDITGPDKPMLEWPHRQNTSVAWWYILVTLVCSFLMINVFVGVIIDNFNKMKEAQNGSGLLTDEQKLWIETMKKTMGQRPIKRLTPPTSKSRRKAWDIAMSSKFEFFIMAIILLNTFMMMLHSYGISAQMKSIMAAANTAFLVIFTFEAMVKLYGLGWQYFKVGWNCFDFSLVLFGYLGVIGGLGPLASLLRIFRVARIFRLVRTSQGLLTIFRTLVYSIPSMINVGGIFCLLMLIYSILGMNLFAKIKHGELLNEDANFSGFFISMATLFRVSTGESFNGIMHDCMIQEPYCSQEEGNCGYPSFAPIFFCSYLVLSAYTLLSMITAIILDNFNDNNNMAHNFVTEEHIEIFREEWAKLDPDGTMFISEEILPKLVYNVPYPLGVKDTPDSVAKGRSKRKLANQLIRSIDVPSIRGNVAFNDVLTELTGKAMPDIEIPEENEVIMQIKGKKSEHQSKMLKKMGTSKENILYNAGQVNAIMLIQSAMRGFIQRRNLEALTEKINASINNPDFGGEPRAVAIEDRNDHGEDDADTLETHFLDDDKKPVAAATAEPVPEASPPGAGGQGLAAEAEAAPADDDQDASSDPTEEAETEAKP